MSLSPASGPALTRRSLLAGSAAGLAMLVAGCTSSSSSGRKDDAATGKQADALAAQVTVQQTVVAAYAAVTAADAALGAQVAELATQATQQLTRLEAAAPGASTKSAASSAATAVPAGQDPQTWLRGQIGAAADSHTTACLTQTGARAALLGSIAAGLRGQAAVLS
jgi:hypothetical protein